jgi:hypothetical protein
MCRLTDEQYDKVVAALTHNGVVYKRLAPELADHLSTAVEEHMCAGLAFPQALQQAIRDFGGSQAMTQVQQQTFLVHQSLSIMFRFLQIALIITYCMTLVGIVFKWIKIPGADEMLILGLGFVSTISIISLFLRFDLAGKTGIKRVLTIVLRLLFAVGISSLYIGFLFRLLLFPGAAEMQVLGAAFLGLVLVIALLNAKQVRELIVANATFFVRIWAVPTVMIILLMTVRSLT